MHNKLSKKTMANHAMMTGQLLHFEKEKKVETDFQQEFDFSQLPPGQYFLSIQLGEKQYSRQWMKR